MNLFEDAGQLVGVRPEHVRLEGRGARGESLADGQVKSVEYLGADSIIALTVGSSRPSPPAPRPFLIRVPGRAPVRAGDAIRVAWDKGHEHRFDPHTGGRKP